MKRILVALGALVTATAWAGNITVTSPNSGDFLGTSNSVKFLITAAVVEVTVDVTATLDSNPLINVTVQRRFTPNSDGKIDNNVPLNFSPSTPEGAYTLTVVVTEPGNTYNTVAPIPINVDVKAPNFGNSNPLSGSYVRGNVPIVIDLDEPNVKEWRVKINNGDIPNNSGSTNLVNVNWDSNTIITDGSQTISVSVEDLAGNTSNKSIPVTVDRINPSSTILAPTGSSTLRPGSTFAVLVEISDQFQGSVHWTGVRVRMETIGGAPMGLVPRRSVTNQGSKITWAGRIRTSGSTPTQFKIIVDAVDRAGNVAVTQEVTVNLSRSRSRGRVDYDDDDHEDEYRSRSRRRRGR
jgi:hypothetical protein